MTAPTEAMPEPYPADRVLTRVDFWFDPLCPWAWVTSRWLIEAATVRPLEPHFRVMSLAVLNADTNMSEEYKKGVQRGWAPLRVCVAAGHRGGAAAVAALYTALGTRMHTQQEELDRALIERALVDAGLPADLIAAADSEEYDDEIRASHEDAMSRVGTDVGTPVIAVGDVAFFGPVVTPIPRGEAAGLLWDGVVLCASTDGFFELKRSRDRRPSFD